MSNVCTYCKEIQQLGHYCQALLDMLEPCPWCRGPAVEWFLGTVCCPDKDCPGWRVQCSPEDWNRRATTPEAEALREIAEVVDSQLSAEPFTSSEAVMEVANILIDVGYGAIIPVPMKESGDVICVPVLPVDPEADERVDRLVAKRLDGEPTVPMKGEGE